jgi:YD repeat-containing protein
MTPAPLACLAVALTLLIQTAAQAQQREFFDARTGKSVGRSTTDSQGSTTIYGADGRVTGRTATDTQGTTKFYDAAGRNVGSVTTTKPQGR